MANDLKQTLAPPAALAVSYLPIDEVVQDDQNAREHSPAQIRQIARSIETFGFNAPLLIDKDNKVIAGNGRLMALRLLGANEVPVLRVQHMSPTQARLYSLADNKLTDNSCWNERQLGLHFKALAELDLGFSLEVTGFSIGEIDVSIEGLCDPTAEDDPDDLPPQAGPAVCSPGDQWRLGRHRLHCANALDGDAYTVLMGEERAAMVITDPPYNVPINGYVSNLKDAKGRHRHREFSSGVGEMSDAEFTAYLAKVCGLMACASADQSLHYIFMTWKNAFALMAAGRIAYDDLLNICVWTKPGGGMGGLYRSAHELILVFKHGRAAHRNNVKLGKYGRNRTNVWAYEGAAGLRRSEDADLIADHPTPKPVRLIADAILDASARGDWVLDPFLGSGTTLIACERVGRRCAGMEIDPLYVDLTIRRWQRLTGEDAIRESDGASFDSLAARVEAAP